jgi:hypothetical protein
LATYTERRTAKGERRWRVEVRPDGFPRRSATFTTRREAERWAQKLEGEIDSNRNLPDLEGERHTVSELLDRWTKDLTEKRPDAVSA